jgi:hypothetical protein
MDLAGAAPPRSPEPEPHVLPPRTPPQPPLQVKSRDLLAHPLFRISSFQLVKCSVLSPSSSRDLVEETV